MTKTIYLETLKSAPGRSIFHYSLDGFIFDKFCVIFKSHPFIYVSYEVTTTFYF